MLCLEARIFLSITRSLRLEVLNSMFPLNIELQFNFLSIIEMFAK